MRQTIRFLLIYLSTFLALSCVTFTIGRVMPNDPVLAAVGDRASQEVYDQVYQEMGLDRPVPVQYLLYLKGILSGDFGTSIVSGEPVWEDVKRRFPATVELAVLATILGVAIGVPMGVASAIWRGKPIDHILRIVMLIGYSVPIFWLALMALVLFYVKLDWLPGPGRQHFLFIGQTDKITGILMIDWLLQGRLDVMRDAIYHLVLPVSMLTLFSLAFIGRMTRSFMLDQLSQEYVLTARVKGLPEHVVIGKHVMRNVMVQLITVIALTFASLLEGSILIETIFAWPGLGLYITNSLFNADMNAVVGGITVVGSCYLLLNLLSDVLYRMADPRAHGEAAHD